MPSLSKAAIFAAIFLCALCVAQESGIVVVPLSSEDAALMSSLYRQRADLEKRIDTENKRIGQHYLKPEDGQTFRYSKDFKYVMPNATESNSSGCLNFSGNGMITQGPCGMGGGLNNLMVSPIGSPNAIAFSILVDGDPIQITGVGGTTTVNTVGFAKVTGQDSTHFGFYSDAALTTKDTSK